MRRINTALRKQINKDPYYKRCVLTGIYGTDGWGPDRISIHHAFIYARKQIDEEWNLVPVLWRLHDPRSDDKEAIHRDGKDNKEIAELYALQRAIDLYGSLDPLYDRYPKYDWMQRFDYLMTKWAFRI